ncbi:MAG: hypothetical protein IKV72_03480, partial [Firmicutes bacterium]|nr:hypothetical protein [Bacillota bacterium]
MIRVRLLTEPEYRTLWRTEPGFREYKERHFYDLLREKGDFTDAESLALLRHLHGEQAVQEKWYRRTTADGKPCIPAISREAMYGLVVIENSRHGRYTPLEEAFSDFEVEQRMEERMGDHDNPVVWQAFAQMDIDILLTYRIKDFTFAWEIPIDEEFVLENLVLNGIPTEVHVVQDYLFEPEQRDGIWYMGNHFYDQKYWWGNDIPEILKLLGQEFAGQPPLAKGLFPLETFEAMCWPSDAGNALVMNRIREEQEEENQTHWQVVNHMDYLPADGESRRLMYLIIEEYADGNFCIQDNISVKYPSYGEMFYEAMDMAKPDCEMFILPVDVNECMSCATDLRKAVCAFRTTEGII